MNNGITITNSNSFESSILVFEDSLNNIKEIFENQNNNMEKINNTEVWTGKVQKSIYNKYIEMKNNYSLIEESLNTYISFMKKALDEYKKSENDINKNAEMNAFELDINS